MDSETPRYEIGGDCEDDFIANSKRRLFHVVIGAPAIIGARLAVSQ